MSTSYVPPSADQAPPLPYDGRGPAPKQRMSTVAVIAICVTALIGLVIVAATIAMVANPTAAQENIDEGRRSVESTKAAEAAPPTAAPAVEAPRTTEAPQAPTKPEKAAAGTIAMPDVVGMNAAVAQDKLEKLGFTNIEFGSVDSTHTVVLMVSNWTVEKQSSKAGTELAPDDLIVLGCSKV